MSTPTQDTAHHPAVAEVLRHFSFDHLPEHLRPVSAACHDLAHLMATHLKGPMLTNGLHKLLEAKDAFVRAAAHPPKE